jgi:hypothetical protein
MCQTMVTVPVSATPRKSSSAKHGTVGAIAPRAEIEHADRFGVGLARGLSWGDCVAWLVELHGTLAATAERLAAHRGYVDDAGSVERALRRLRARGQQDGGA